MSIDPRSPAALGIEVVTVITRVPTGTTGHREVPMSVARLRFSDGAATPVKGATIPVVVAKHRRGRYSKHAL